MAEKDIHYYEPANGHGLKHDPFNAIVAPRPIGWISSRDAKGNINLAPYSFFNAFCYKPPIVGFSSTSWKDSVANIEETYSLTTKIFELSHVHPPTARLLIDAMPVMQELSNSIDQSCHMTVYSQGRQVGSST